MIRKKLDNLNRQITMYQSQGYNVASKDENTYVAIMEKEGEQNTVVHIVLAFFTWWLCFAPNIIYYFYAKKKKQITVFG